MKKRILILSLILFLIIPRSVCAYSAAEIVTEVSTGRILHSLNAQTPLPMASTTKIMTAITAIEYGDLSSTVTASKFASGITGSRMELHEGDQLTLQDMITALLFVSANDGATAIAEHISGNEKAFAELMTKKAKDMGCKNTSFANAHGLDEEGHYTTAEDLAIISAYAIKNDIFREIISLPKKELTLNGNPVMFYNKNKLKSMYEYGLGGKTGYTEEAGRCLVSYAEKDGMMIVSVVLNSTDYYGDSIKLLEDTFGKYSMVKIASKGDYVRTIPITGGYEKTYTVTLPEDIIIPLTEGEKDIVEIKYQLPQILQAPINTSNEIGRYAVTSGDERILLGTFRSDREIRKRDTIFEIMIKALAGIVY